MQWTGKERPTYSALLLDGIRPACLYMLSQIDQVKRMARAMPLSSWPSGPGSPQTWQGPRLCVDHIVNDPGLL